jgi:lysophospholipase L1-like esterase
VLLYHEATRAWKIRSSREPRLVADAAARIEEGRLSFCARHQLPCFEAFDVSHPAGAGTHELFLDDLHPSPAGHAALAEGLARFLSERGLLPGAEPG